MKSVFSIACRYLFSVQFCSVPLQFSVWKNIQTEKMVIKCKRRQVLCGTESQPIALSISNILSGFEYISIRICLDDIYEKWHHFLFHSLCIVTFSMHGGAHCSLFTVKRWHQTKLRSRYSNIVPTHERKTTLYDRIRFCANRAYTI